MNAAICLVGNWIEISKWFVVTHTQFDYHEFYSRNVQMLTDISTNLCTHKKKLAKTQNINKKNRQQNHQIKWVWT